MDKRINKFKEIMEQEGLHEIVVESFLDYYKQLLHGSTGKVTEAEINPPIGDNIAKNQELNNYLNPPYEQLAVVKLNGGLGTSMGLTKAKSLLEVKGKLNFLDIIAKQMQHLREKTDEEIPLILMDSFNTRSDTLDYLTKYPELSTRGLPLDFLQNKFPKIKQNDLTPLRKDQDNLNWNPPGHGEIYMTLYITGILDKLMANGINYLFISNSDNLGAMVDRDIFGFFADEDIPFMMEVCKRTEMDKKGGHLAQTKQGKLILREIAQCPKEELKYFQDIEYYEYFNTNNLWVNLSFLKKKLDENQGKLPLSLIINPKVVGDEKVYQLETAMGSAISAFEGAQAVEVSKERLVPVKKTNDLLAVRSDAFELGNNFQLKLVKSLSTTPNIELEQKYYKKLPQFENHFSSLPSLKNCKSLQVKEEVLFGKNVTIKGDVKINKSIELENENLENVEI